MTKNKSVSYNINNDNKKEAEKIIRKLGFTPPFIINLLYLKTIENRKIPFDISQYSKDKNVRYFLRIEKKTKESAEKIIKSVGLNHTSLLNIFYDEIIKRNGLPFEVKTYIDKKKK
jgi:addiction module RelB/DinJ family antitoxin